VKFISPRRLKIIRQKIAQNENKKLNPNAKGNSSPEQIR
jgi:hypothetical protein